MDNIWYHGTSRTNAYFIMKEGFKICDVRHGRNQGNGIYISQKLKSACYWTMGDEGIIIKCNLKPSLNILWVYEGYDTKVIDYLKREFGKDILKLGTHFYKAIPQNKQLTKKELINLVNYFFEYRSKKRQKPSGRLFCKNYRIWEQFPYLMEYLRRHQFDGIGDRTFEYWDSDGVCIFNPSYVTTITAHTYTHGWDPKTDFTNIKLSLPLIMPQLKELHEKDEEEMREFLGEDE